MIYDDKFNPDDLLRDVIGFRSRFQIFQDKIHLASNAMGAVSDATEEACRNYLSDRINFGASWEAAIGKQEELRNSFADLINAKPQEVAICYSATQGLGVLSTSIDWLDRRKIISDDYNFPSVAQLWHAQKSRGAEVVRIPPDSEGIIRPEYVANALDKDVGLISVSHVCYKNGHRLNLERLGDLVKGSDAFYLVDDYQGCGTRQIDVNALGIDIYVAGAVKFLLGSAGVGFLFVKEDLLENLHPTITGWFGQKASYEMEIEAHEEAIDASRFQIGTPSVSAIYESLAGLNLIKSVGIYNVEKWISYITNLVFERLTEEGFVLATPLHPENRGAQVAIKTVDGAKVVTELEKRGIITTTRDNNIRTAWHFYNTPEDVDALISAFQDLRDLMLFHH